MRAEALLCSLSHHMTREGFQGDGWLCKQERDTSVSAFELLFKNNCDQSTDFKVSFTSIMLICLSSIEAKSSEGSNLNPTKYKVIVLMKARSV